MFLASLLSHVKTGLLMRTRPPSAATAATIAVTSPAATATATPATLFPRPRFVDRQTAAFEFFAGGTLYRCLGALRSCHGDKSKSA